MSGGQHLFDLFAVDALLADDDEAAAALLTGCPWPIVIMVDAAADSLHLQAHRLGGNFNETLDAKNVFRSSSFRDTGGQCFRIGHGGQIDDEAVEIVVFVVKLAIMMGAAVFDILLHRKAETNQNGGVDCAIRGDDDLRGPRQMLENMSLRLFQTGVIEEIGLGEHDEIGAGDLILEDFFHRIVVIERFVIRPLGGKRFHVMRHLALCKGGTVHDSHHGIHRYAALDRRPLERLHQGLRQGKARGLDEDMLHLRLAAEDLFNGRLEIIRDRAADAAIGQFDDVFLRAALNAAAFENFAIDADITELIDDDGQSLAIKLFEKTAQQRGFSGPRKPVTMVQGTRSRRVLMISPR